MTSSERLYLTLDRGRVVQHGHPQAAFLLAAAGSNIPPQYVPLVELYYAAKSVEAAAAKNVEPAPVPETDGTKTDDGLPVGEDAEGYTTRVLTPKRRGRPRKHSQSTFTGGPED